MSSIVFKKPNLFIKII